MKVSAEFQNGMCELCIVPEDEWERKLLGAVAKGGDKLWASVTYESKGHYTYGECSAARVLLSAGEAMPNAELSGPQ
jgi:hypothetical protein